MLSGYQKFGLLVLTPFLLLLAAEAYRDVDLRIAERKVIPHYRRHSYEYPDIDIKAIMRQRGLLPDEGGIMRPRVVLPKVTQEPWLWQRRPFSLRKKNLDHSNYIEPTTRDSRYKKKYKHYTKYVTKSKAKV